MSGLGSIRAGELPPTRLAKSESSDFDIVGLKISVRPLDAPLVRRLALLRSGLEMIAAAYLANH